MIGKTPDEIVIKLRNLIKKIEQAGALIECDEITRSQIRIILPIIHDKKGYSMKELCKISGNDKAFVSRTIAEVESKGLIERDKKTGSNERNYKIILSEKGKEFFAIQSLKAKEVSTKMLNGVTKGEVRTFIKILFKLTENEPSQDK